ncbi:MAG TPA: hypothetical protein VH678_04820 [Xanthobacteraceae bacterium]|jgi:hypothetical protein
MPFGDALQVLGMTTPFAYAAAVYGFFHYLDKRASGSAKKAISGWLQPKIYDRAAIADAMLELFDRIYTKPLLGWRAFRRSALFTICMSAIFLYEFGLLSTQTETMTLLTGGEIWSWIILSSTLLINTVCDYGALFIIRQLLGFGKHRPIMALFFGPLVGISVVYLAFFVVPTLLLQFGPEQVAMTGIDVVEKSEGYWRLNRLGDSLWSALMPAALVVHLWLPLFALCALLLRALNYFRRAVGGMQWLLKRGREHPLDAIGYIAGILVFVITVVIQKIF